MTRSPAMVTMLLLAACSTGGGSTALDASSPTTPLTSTPPDSPLTAPSSGATAVPAEKNPPGDIPDNIAFIRYANPAGRYSFTHPEGWAETTRQSTVTFTDKLNGVEVLPGMLTTVPTVASANKDDIPALKGNQAAFEIRSVTAVKVPAGSGVRIVYRRNSAPDAVTGRAYRDEVERYEIVAGRHEVIVELFGPVGADNVDAYKTMIDSLTLT